MAEGVENLPHIRSEGIYHTPNMNNAGNGASLFEPVKACPDPIVESVYELGKEFDQVDFIDHEDEVLQLYRGDSSSNLNEMGYDTATGALEGGLSRDFPIYFTTSREEALDHAERKLGDGEKYIIEAEIPFDNLDKVKGHTPREVATNFDQIGLESQKVYFNQPNSSWDSTEWIAVNVPEEWIDIQRI